MELRSLGKDDVVAAGGLLGRAFRDAPGYASVFSHLDEERRARTIVRIKTTFAATAVKHQVADGAFVDGTLAGVALSMAPGMWPVPARVFARMVWGSLTLGPRALGNLLRADKHMQKHHLRERHHYLFVLGVEPEMQGRGIGKALLAQIAERADRDGVPCYLETDKEKNVRIYRAAGYEVVSDENVATRPPFRLWTMLRKTV
jgi:ribosomal protein S18 acetylase RimI-like enzyme